MKISFSLMMLFSLTLHAFPLPYQSLLKLCEESSLIALAEVISVEKVQREIPADPYLARLQRSDPYDHLAILRLIEPLKGGKPGQIIQVQYTDFTCPTPPHFIKGRNPLVFLSCQENRCRTPSESYSVKYLPKEEEEAYIERIRAFFTLPAGTGSEERRKILVEWLVGCVESQATRDEGLAELDWYCDRIMRAACMENRKLGDLLSPEQKERMIQALLHSKEITSADFRLASLAYRWKDSRVIPFLLHYLKNMPDSYKGSKKEEEKAHVALHLMWHILEMKGLSGGHSLTEAFRKACFVIDEKTGNTKYFPNYIRQREIIEQFVSLVISRPDMHSPKN